MKAKFISMLMAFIITAVLIPVYPASAATSGTWVVSRIFRNFVYSP